MGIIKTNGIIITESNMGDYDKMVTMLTPGLGKIGCAAKGARRPRSLLLAGTQFLCFGEYLLYQGANSYHVNSCEVVEAFYNIRTDLEKLKYASHITKLVWDVTDENQNTYKILQLFLNTLYTISETDKNLELVLCIFRLRLCCVLGFVPKIMQCINCKTEDNIGFFSLRENGLKCEDCGRQDKSAIHVQSATKDAIRYIVSAPPKKIFSFNISEEAIKEINLVTKLYMNEKLEKEYTLEELF